MFQKTPYLFSALMLLLAPSVSADSDLGASPKKGPGQTTTYTLQDICNRLENGASGSKSSFSGPASSPENTATCTIDTIMDLLPSIDETNGAEPGEVVTDKTYWGLTSSHWKKQTGSGGPIIDCNDTHPNGIGRLTDNGNGTVTDNCTKLVWLKNANCFGMKTWSQANGMTNLMNMLPRCLPSGTNATDWHLPTVKELASLIDFSQRELALPNRIRGHNGVFSGVQPLYYWSSTPYAARSDEDAWSVHLNYGIIDTNAKTSTHYVWPVRRRE